MSGGVGGDTLSGCERNDTFYGGAGADSLIGGLGNDVFALNRGEADGDTLADFTSNGAGLGDRIVFTGYGTVGDGATFANRGCSAWRITSADGLGRGEHHRDRRGSCPELYRRLTSPAFCPNAVRVATAARTVRAVSSGCWEAWHRLLEAVEPIRSLTTLVGSTRSMHSAAVITMGRLAGRPPAPDLILQLVPC